MTTEQMDWLDDHNRHLVAEGKRQPSGAPWDFLGTCDWGNCNRITAAWRWAPELKTWLTVCDRHTEGKRRWWQLAKRYRRGGKHQEAQS